MQIHSNGSKWAGESPDTVEHLIAVLGTQPLDPRFDEPRFGQFFYTEDGQTWHAFGNFLELSHGFNVSGSADEMKPLEDAIHANLATEAYRLAKAEYLRNQRRYR